MMLVAGTWRSHQQSKPLPLPRLWNSRRAPEVPEQWGSVLLAAFKMKLAFEQLRDQFRTALTGRRLLEVLVFLHKHMGAMLHKLSSLIVIPGFFFWLAFLSTILLKAQMKQLQFNAFPPKGGEVLKQVAQSCGYHNYFGLCPKREQALLIYL